MFFEHASKLIYNKYNKYFVAESTASLYFIRYLTITKIGQKLVLDLGFVWTYKVYRRSGNIWYCKAEFLTSMMEKIDIPVSVSFTFDSQKRKISPRALIWNGRLYGIRKVGLHHKFRQGRTLFHVFSVASKNMFFRLVLNTETLHWRLEEISDGWPS